MPLNEHRHARWHHDPEHGPGGHGGHHRHGGDYGQQGRRDRGRHGLYSGRKLSAADLQIVVMGQLAVHAAHGYELIKALEDHSHGLYVPSPGMIYPALTYLEEIGYASVEVEGTKKRYRLTEAGRSHYEQNRAAADRILSDMERIGAQMAQAREAVDSGQTFENSPSGPAIEDLNAARHDLRAALRQKEPYTEEEARRVAAVLIRATAEIQQRPPEKPGA